MEFKMEFAETNPTFDVAFSESEEEIQMDFERINISQLVGGDPYTGNYSITPGLSDQKLETKHKIMLEDMTVEKIPYYEVTNNSGGLTASIG